MFFTREANDSIEGTLDGAPRKLAAAKASAGRTGESTRLSFDALTEQFEDLRHAVLSQTRSIRKSMSEKTQANPLLAVGFAFAAGVIVAKIFARRSVAPKDPTNS